MEGNERIDENVIIISDDTEEERKSDTVEITDNNNNNISNNHNDSNNNNSITPTPTPTTGTVTIKNNDNGTVSIMINTTVNNNADSFTTSQLISPLDSDITTTNNTVYYSLTDSMVTSTITATTVPTVPTTTTTTTSTITSTNNNETNNNEANNNEINNATNNETNNEINNKTTNEINNKTTNETNNEINNETNNEINNKTTNDAISNPIEKNKKPIACSRRYALSVGYVGSRYHGCQGQSKGAMTIENKLEECLLEIKALEEKEYKKCNFCISRAGRTDNGVHAVCNLFVYSLNVDCIYINNSKNEEETKRNINEEKQEITDTREEKERKFVEMLNSHLPCDIKCFEIFRVTKSFDARKFCSFRMYEYILPIFVLSKVKVNEKYKKVIEDTMNEIDEYVKKQKEKTKNKKRKQYEDGNSKDNAINEDDNEAKDDGPFTNSTEKGTKEISVEETITYTKKTFKSEPLFYIEKVKKDISEEELDYFFDILHDYVGHHNFFCFTKKKSEHTPYRFIKYVEVSKVQLRNHNFVSIKLLGQSFLMHQIRKMITLAVEIFRNTAPRQSILYCFYSNHFVPITLFPPDGLMLLQPYFNTYNETKCSPPHTPKIILDENDKTRHFKNNFIGKAIMQKMELQIWEHWQKVNNYYPFIYYFIKRNELRNEA